VVSRSALTGPGPGAPDRAAPDLAALDLAALDLAALDLAALDRAVPDLAVPEVPALGTEARVFAVFAVAGAAEPALALDFAADDFAADDFAADDFGLRALPARAPASGALRVLPPSDALRVFSGTGALWALPAGGAVRALPASCARPGARSSTLGACGASAAESAGAAEPLPRAAMRLRVERCGRVRGSAARTPVLSSWVGVGGSLSPGTDTCTSLLKGARRGAQGAPSGSREASTSGGDRVSRPR